MQRRDAACGVDPSAGSGYFSGAVWELSFVILVLLVVLFALRGSPELARIQVRAGKPRFVAGRMPKRLLDDYRDVLSDPAISRADVRIVVESGKPRVVAKGLPEAKLQQLRNVTGAYQTAQMRAGHPPSR